MPPAGTDLIAAHLAAFDPDVERARDRLEDTIGTDLATLLVAALSPHNVSTRPARSLAAVAA